MKKLIALFGFVLVFSAFSHRANAAVGQLSIGDKCNDSVFQANTVTISISKYAGSGFSDPYNFLVEIYAPEMQRYPLMQYSRTIPYYHSHQNGQDIWAYSTTVPLGCVYCQFVSGCPARIIADPGRQNVVKDLLVPCTRPPGYCY